MRPALETAALPADAIEVGRIADAWGIKGWFKVLPHSASPEALFSSKRWFLLPPDRPMKPSRVVNTASSQTAQAWTEPLVLRIRESKDHSDTIVASAHDIDDRNAAEALRGARIFVPRSSFPSAGEGEYYWVDLIGLQVVNREGLDLGQVRDLMSTGPQTVLVLEAAPETEGGKPVERMIPFVSAFVDGVDLPAKRITVDWQPDY
ncbi:ribosome maturation factor RimM [Limnohabitans radicicola]|uniref:Ribosome maturation factor RimM n=1 Tax=Limnohabitans radicicola TaxID=2771427 RepID=A0A927II56_9BURK|nr:ribosome maturation factor RimM [Limnohabitans radicicola]MBD8049249.1 ribosome maturation factor RimM [Limnohabitans radicicola]